METLTKICAPPGAEKLAKVPPRAILVLVWTNPAHPVLKQ
jgi:hypothetical protein